MDNETRQHIQKLEQHISLLVDQVYKLQPLVTKQGNEIAELKKKNRALETDIQILKDGGNI